MGAASFLVKELKSALNELVKAETPNPTGTEKQVAEESFLFTTRPSNPCLIALPNVGTFAPKRDALSKALLVEIRFICREDGRIWPK